MISAAKTEEVEYFDREKVLILLSTTLDLPISELVDKIYITKVGHRNGDVVQVTEKDSVLIKGTEAASNMLDIHVDGGNSKMIFSDISFNAIGIESEPLNTLEALISEAALSYEINYRFTFFTIILVRDGVQKAIMLDSDDFLSKKVVKLN